MWSSVASLSLLLAASVHGDQLSRQDADAWSSVQPSIAILVSGGTPQGAAALIDDAGLFLAHHTVVAGREVSGRLSDGRTLQLRRLAQDETTGFVLLEAANWQPGRVKALDVATSAPASGTRIFAALGAGPLRAEFVADGRWGVMGAARRLMPLSELRFEAPIQTVAGALLFTADGALLGAVNATVEAPDDGTQSANKMQRALSGIAQSTIQIPRFGPAQLTVAYTLGTDVMRRVVDGFRSDSHEVVYPAIGVFCRDAVGGGAEVERVIPSSPAAQAGLLAGDVIVDIGGAPVDNQVVFARVMMHQRVGSKVAMRVKRAGKTLLLDVVVGKQG
jgi:serine protease Do